jgi:uncharacterized membrane protein YraQ (UPF0718 family)
MTTQTHPSNKPLIAGVILLLISVAGLINYKAGGAIAAVSKVQTGGTISTKTLWSPTIMADSATFVHLVNYAGWVVIALSFGLVIGAAVKAFLPTTWLARIVDGGTMKGQLLAALFAAPLMLCSCCATPIFEGVYSRSKRLGPSLAMLLAPPGLNPGAIVLTFLLFPGSIGFVRLVGSVLVVVIGSALIDKRYAPPVMLINSSLEERNASLTSLPQAFGSALFEVSVRSLPAILFGIVLSAWLITSVPLEGFASSLSGVPLLFGVTLVAVLVAIPTFAEIPVGLALLALGAPHGVVVAVLIAMPIINLPSLMGLAKLASPKVSMATATMVFVGAIGAGLFLGV